MSEQLGPDIIQTLLFTYERRSRRLFGSDALTTTGTSPEPSGEGCTWVEHAGGRTSCLKVCCRDLFTGLQHWHLPLKPKALKYSWLSMLTSSSVSSTCVEHLFHSFCVFFFSLIVSVACKKCPRSSRVIIRSSVHDWSCLLSILNQKFAGDIIVGQILRMKIFIRGHKRWAKHEADPVGNNFNCSSNPIVSKTVTSLI